MADLVLYGLDAAGEAAFTQRLTSAERDSYRVIAESQLAKHHAVEVWEGPLCILRLRRKTPGEA